MPSGPAQRLAPPPLSRRPLQGILEFLHSFSRSVRQQLPNGLQPETSFPESPAKANRAAPGRFAFARERAPPVSCRIAEQLLAHDSGRQPMRWRSAAQYARTLRTRARNSRTDLVTIVSESNDGFGANPAAKLTIRG